MKTKLFSLFLALVASVGIAFASVYVTIDGIAYNLHETDLTASVGDNHSLSGDIVIPDQITYDAKTYSVTRIVTSAFGGCSSLTSITIPNSVVSIGARAFSSCTSLTSVTIPNSVTSIDTEAFRYCTGLTSVTIGNGINEIGRDIFSGCSKITSVTLNSSYIVSFDYAPYYDRDGENICSIFGKQVQEYVLGESVTSIGSSAFQSCSASVIISNSVTSIGGWAFCACSFTSITIPSSVTSIGKCAFQYCRQLTSITCEAVNPPDLECCVFDEMVKSIPLYVPAESVTAYKAADQWKEFNVLAIGSNAVEDVLSDDAQSTKVLRDGKVLILRGDKTYTAQGQELK